MTKHYCDMCGREIEEYETTAVTFTEPEEMRVYMDAEEEWELCTKCAGKVRDFIIEGKTCQS